MIQVVLPITRCDSDERLDLWQHRKTHWLNEKALAAKLNFSQVLQEALLAKLA